MIANPIPYPKMKDSGVPWLGEVPEHWDVLPNRVLFGEVKERDHPEEPMLSVTITKGVIRQRALLANSSKKDSSNQDKSAYKLVRLGDIAYNKMRAWQGAIGVSDYQGIVSPAYVVERPRKGTSSRYLHYLLRTPAFAKEAERWSYGITSDMWSLRPEHFKMIYGCLPPLHEQSAIVRYLDHVDRRIRRYIHAKQKLIPLLEEQKQALIHRAVTRGLDPNVRLKSSGVPWLGDVPEHWDVRRLGTSVKGCINGIWGNDPNGSEDLPCVRVADFDRVRLRVRLAKPTLRAIAPDERNRRLLKKGDLLLEKSGGGDLQPVGVVMLYDHDAEAVCSNFVARMPVSARCDSSYLMYLHSHLYAIRLNVRSIKQTTGIQNLDSSSYLGEPVTFPSLAEQADIARFLDEAAADIDDTVNRTRRQIELLSEYRTRLIADVVTGKLDVRSVAARLPDEIKEPEPLDQADPLIDGEEEPIEAATTREAAV